MSGNRSLFPAFRHWAVCVPVFMLLGWSACLGAAVESGSATTGVQDGVVSLTGVWGFVLDSSDAGVAGKWFARGRDRSTWRPVNVPHTWAVELGVQVYRRVAWYSRVFETDPAWKGKDVRLEFDAVYQDARVWVNGTELGEHVGSGWTAFGWSLDGKLNPTGPNEIVVRVDARFSDKALPYRKSFDWAADGGIIRAVRLRIRPVLHIDGVYVHADLSADRSKADVEARVELTGGSGETKGLSVEARAFDPSGNVVLKTAAPVEALKDGHGSVRLAGTISKPELWHFDFPRLYRWSCRLVQDGVVVHEKETTFGIRRVEIKQGLYFLNDEPMRLMGVEWMPGSDPRYGMAEPAWLARRVLADMKRLNGIITRFHWEQDESVFEFCDREGILVQEEVPAWGAETMHARLDDAQTRHTREMILSHYNHPSIYAWGLCNEVGGQSPEAHAFVRRGIEIARSLDPHRLLTYASNSLQQTPEKDAAGLCDFIEWNEYYETWYGGTVDDMVANLARIHAAFPLKSLVISEYGLCECAPKNPSGDARRIEMLRTHTDAYRQAGGVAGAIYFDYNDYRTHIGDKGLDEFRQRVHGVVDLFGRPKPSWEALRREASPIRSLRILRPRDAGDLTRADVAIETRLLENDLPAYTLREYDLIWIAYNQYGQPLGSGRRHLPDLPPGMKVTEDVAWPKFKLLTRIWVEVVRPTGYSVLDAEWKAPSP